jgi:hypothetical protein
MRCSSGHLAEDCAIIHWCPGLNGRREPATFRGPCPICSRERRLSWWPGTDWRLDWRSHCGCPRDQVLAAIITHIPCASSRTPREPSVSTTTLRNLAERDLPASAYRIALLQMTGMSAQQGRDYLKLPRRTFYDAMRALG